ncbi:hypothetical protein IMG5_074870 [Ichthyophthirius multifiliis]|uniref:PDEase domain-containing protein n=1 Tax=Ichthyophthirius multifiliis TaxID=5932 RepID=G0QQ35_ICHMU|nr:hypothetical protein IMG5_074870 [Ichthyophthirius multifiliis]EGR32677.1 hypothetical protein IMG5_074870 [Ichthyophthirius multifiliis]|eukprot:XP_004036663.1 hypothetical protein IMG5_074870 [Ichthyophthirius multifiliis]
MFPQEIDFVDEWEFNSLSLKKNEELYTVAWNILERRGFVEKYMIKNKTFANFIQHLQYGYNKKRNFFHNFNHGIAVMQSCHMLTKCQKSQSILKDIDVFTVIFSGLCHDVGHTGRTNNFEIAVQSKLAIRYHDKSVLEQHHLAQTFKIMLNMKNSNILQNLQMVDFQYIRKQMISNILYTDIKLHFKLKQDFDLYWKKSDEKLEEKSALTEQPENIQNRDQYQQQIEILTGMIIHTADFNGAVKKFLFAKQWSERVNKEFNNQYMEEGVKGIIQTPFMKDLDKTNIMARAEKEFLGVIVLPLWEILNSFYEGELNHIIGNINESIQEWEKLAAQEEFQTTEKIENLEVITEKEETESLKQIQKQ